MQTRSPSPGETPGKMHPLTSLRFFAALYVVFFHTASKFHLADLLASKRWLLDPLRRVLSLGYVSVSFFFLLSGYILAMVYLRGNAPVLRQRFWIARFARIYPLFFLTMLLDVPHLWLERIVKYGTKAAALKTVVTIFAHAVLIQAWTMKLRGLDSPNWSLSAEAVFYLSFPFLGVVLWKLRGKVFWLWVAGLYCGGQLVVLALAHRLSGEESLEYQPLLHLSTFLLGILLARRQTQSRWFNADQGPSPAVLYAVLAAATVVFCGAVYFYPHLSMINVRDGLLAPIFAAVIWALSYPRTAVAQWLSARWLVVLGEASFGLYLIHYLVLHLFQALGLSSASIYPIYILLCVGLSVASFFWFETPARRWLLARLHTPSRESVEAAAAAQ